MSDTETQLAVVNVSKSFGGVVANADISLQVMPGEIVALIGPNGSGKSTLFNSIVGYHPLDGGQIVFEGTELNALRVRQIAALGLVRTFQSTRIYGEMSCLENMLISSRSSFASWRSILQRPSPAAYRRAEELLDFVGIVSKRHFIAGTMSFGQQKLLEFAMALMNEPRMLLLDEPTAGINPTLINGLITKLKQANAEFGLTLFVIEHNMRVVMNLAQRVYCLAHGRMLAEGTAAEIRDNPVVLEAYLGAK